GCVRRSGGATGPAEAQARRHAGFATAPREARQGGAATASRSAALVRPAAAPREPSATQEGEHPGGYADPDDPSEGPRTPQGSSEPLHTGSDGGAASPGTVTREEIIDRARTWLAAKVPYSMSAYRSDGYRQDCSGFVSMAWDLRSNQWTGSLASFGERITKDELQPGDMLLFHNAQDPEDGSHVTLFGGWADAAHTKYTAYEQTPPRTRSRTTPYAYWTNSSRYIPYRPKNLASGSAGPRSSAFPGAVAFGPGKAGAHVTRLGEMLVARGAGRYYRIGPGPRWTEADRRATAAFQRAQGWRGTGADGIPGPRTWAYLTGGKGGDVR
ncbi:NlpC/P60 family protein, partial [Streptomyces sp. TverLS-915]|uniref:peptidoglycan-binding protein n=1 Tax=Streptomyces sp. TverLS-915 TaxID=1839763 RepID=UPI00081E9AAC